MTTNRCPHCFGDHDGCTPSTPRCSASKVTTVASCRYSHEGTYGHECGKPATVCGGLQSAQTVSGLYWTFRCDACKDEKGRDNRKLSTGWLPLESMQRNVWL